MNETINDCKQILEVEIFPLLSVVTGVVTVVFRLAESFGKL